MKKISVKQQKLPVHFVAQELLNPTNAITVNLIGAGGTGSQVLTALARINHALIELRHPGLYVRLFDDDIVSPYNLGRQLFTTAEIGLPKSVALMNRVNRFFGTNWKAVAEKYNLELINQDRSHAMATINISCVDTVKARFEIAGILQTAYKSYLYHHNHPLYWMDYGNSKDSGQVILSTIGTLKQPQTKKFVPVAALPMVTSEFAGLLKASEKSDSTPSCSLAEALEKQDLFINSAIAQAGASLIWSMFREGMICNRGFFFSLKDFRMQPLKIATPATVVRSKKQTTQSKSHAVHQDK